MGKYLKEFETHTEYENYTADTANFILPNVSYCVDTPNEVHYNPYVEPLETRVVAKFNITSTSSPTPISYKYYGTDGTSGFSAIEVDGVELPNVVSAYTFSTTGEHIVKYTLKDPTTIGAYSFYDCTSITSITIPDSVTSISSDAFYHCKILTSVNIPTNVTSIDSYAFTYCEKIESIEIPDGVTTIKNQTFQNCFALADCTIGSGVTSIGNSAFLNCYALDNLTIKATNPPSLGSNVFNNIQNVFTIYVPSGSVEAYKAASGWSKYASRIQAIS